MNPDGALRALVAILIANLVSSNLLQNDLDHCEVLAKGRHGRQGHQDVPSVAGSYIPGELFWKRPQVSLAPCFKADIKSHYSVGCPSKIQMKLDEQCAINLYEKTAPHLDLYHLQADLNPLFYIRLVGPAIFLGSVERHSFHNFTIKFMAQRPGHYMLDVVVEYSSIIENNTLAFYKQDSTYEGTSIPGSPFNVFVAPNTEHRGPDRVCAGAELGNAPGTWLLADVTKTHTGPVKFTSAEFWWSPDKCKMPDLSCLISAASKSKGTCLQAGRKAMIFTIGDSVTRLQAKNLADLLGETIEGEGETYIQRTMNTVFEIHFQATNEGMIPRMPAIKGAINRLFECQLSGSCTPVIHFNSGLHDLDKYCGNLEHQVGFRRSTGLDKDFDCITSYVRNLQQVIDYVEAIGFKGVKVFRSTTAAWLKFGNFNLDWFSPDKRDEQVFISNWFSVIKFNELAVPLFEKAGWHVIDGFQSSIGRPDHTERTPGGAFVHFDPEVPTVHNHQLLSFVYQDLCPDVLETCSRRPSLPGLALEQN